MTIEKALELGQQVVDELEHYRQHLPVKHFNQTDVLSGGSAGQDELARRLNTVNVEMRRGAEEPFVSFVRVEETKDGGEPYERVYLIARTYLPMFSPSLQNAMFANRNSKLGEIGFVDVGDELTIRLPRGGEKTITVLARDSFMPDVSDHGVWDARNNKLTIKFDNYRPASLRSWLKESGRASTKNVEYDDQELVAAISAEEMAELELRSRKDQDKKNLQTFFVGTIALKDQPMLDKFQDEFCRLPLTSSILLIGAPGTGKTTTLIKRIAFKMDIKHLEEYDGDFDTSSLGWLMFTPNDLLKGYLKEAMNKEHLSASDQNVKTWENERIFLARDVLRYLRSGDKGYFARNKRTESFNDPSSRTVMNVALKFQSFVHTYYREEFTAAVDALTALAPRPEIITAERLNLWRRFVSFREASQRVKGYFSRQTISSPQTRTLFALEAFERVIPLRAELRKTLTETFRSITDSLIARNPGLLERLVEIVTSLKATPVEESDVNNDADLDEEANEELEREETETTSDRVAALRLLQRALISLGESRARKLAVSNKTQREVISLVGPMLKDVDALEFFGSLNYLTRSPVFQAMTKTRLVATVPQFYGRFRKKLIESEPDLYSLGGVVNSKDRRVSESEIDILVYTGLLLTKAVFKESRSLLENETKSDLFENLKGLYRSQVVVDEASDFSAVQLGCMSLLSHPSTDSITLAGDLMQRVTSFGLTKWEELNELQINFRKTEVNVSYRQTPILLEIASEMFRNVLGENPPFRSSMSTTNEYPLPLKFQSPDEEVVGEWVVRRIIEVYRILGSKLPSIAVFVPEESDLDWAYDAISDLLDEQSIDVEKCPEGKVLGTDAKVRIFSVEYIKGLEFEAVFFLGIDRMGELSADLLDKYLYVGLTRATTFLGVTYESEFPARIGYVEDKFSTEDWRKWL